LLQADLIEPFLLQYYALSAHAYTRGTWIAPESTDIDRNKSSPSFATPVGLTAPILLKWLLVWEEPMKHTVWFCKALPRVWLSHGENVRVENATTAYGRVSLFLHSALEANDGNQMVIGNLTIPLDWSKGLGPPGGCRLRLRVPGEFRIAHVSAGGKEWQTFGADAETVDISSEQLSQPGALSALQHLVVKYRRDVLV